MQQQVQVTLVHRLLGIVIVAASIARFSTSNSSMSVSWDPRKMNIFFGNSIGFIVAVLAIVGLSFS